MKPASVCVVIPTLGGGPKLKRTLASLASQSAPADLVIVVAHDDARDLASIETDYGCTLVRDSGPGDRRSQARNLGAAMATTDALLFLDDDMEASAGLVEECRHQIGSGAQALVIPELTAGSGLMGRLRAWERALVQRQVRLCFPRAVRRDVFMRSGGFAESLTGFEDLDLTASLLEAGVPIGETHVALVHHEEGVGLGSYLRKRLQYAQSAKAYRTRHPEIANDVLSPLLRVKMYAQGIHSPRDLPMFALAIGVRSLELESLR